MEPIVIFGRGMYIEKDTKSDRITFGWSGMRDEKV